MSMEIIESIRTIDRTIYGPNRLKVSHKKYLKKFDHFQEIPIDLDVLEYAFQEIVSKFDSMESEIQSLESRIAQLESA